MSGDPHFRGATPESLARALLRPRRRKPSGAPEAVPARAWGVGLDTIFEKGKARLDTSPFDPKIDAHIESLTGTDTQFLQDVAEVRLPGRFERVWAIDSEQGRPYLNATDLLTLFALGIPSQVRYLSPESDTNFDGLVIRKDWILLTCSGTIGRVYHIPERLDGWVATHDLIRIIPNSPDLVGFLFAWCRTPIAQSQILGHTHGGQIKHVTASQIGSMLVPKLKRQATRKINRRIMTALSDRERALAVLTEPWPRK